MVWISAHPGCGTTPTTLSSAVSSDPSAVSSDRTPDVVVFTPIAHAREPLSPDTSLGQKQAAALPTKSSDEPFVDQAVDEKSKVSRIERGVSPPVTIEDLVLLGALVALRPSIKLFPSGRPLGDVGQIELLPALNARMYSS